MATVRQPAAPARSMSALSTSSSCAAIRVFAKYSGAGLRRQWPGPSSACPPGSSSGAMPRSAASQPPNACSAPVQITTSKRSPASPSGENSESSTRTRPDPRRSSARARASAANAGLGSIPTPVPPQRSSALTSSAPLPQPTSRTRMGPRAGTRASMASAFSWLTGPSSERPACAIVVKRQRASLDVRWCPRSPGGADKGAQPFAASALARPCSRYACFSRIMRSPRRS